MEVSVSIAGLEALQRITEIECGLPMDSAEASDEFPNKPASAIPPNVPILLILDTKR